LIYIIFIQWWNEEVKEKVKEKKEAYAEYMNSGEGAEREIRRGRYKVAKKEAKKAVTVAKSMTFDRLYHKLKTKKGKKEVFKLARARERKTKDLDIVRCIKDENGKVLTDDAEIKKRWQRYFSKLLNSKVTKDSRSRDRECSERRPVPRICGHITKDDIKEALKKMTNGKTAGPNQILVEVWKYLGEEGL